MAAGDLEDRDRMQGFPTDQQVAFYFRIGPGLQPLFGVPEILICDRPEGVGRLKARLGLFVRRVFAIGNQAQESKARLIASSGGVTTKIGFMQNGQPERPEPAANGLRIHRQRNGWFGSAPGWGSGL